MTTPPLTLRLSARDRARLAPPPPFPAWSYGALLVWLREQGVDIRQPLGFVVEENTGDVVVEVELAPLPQRTATARPYFLTEET